ncbi:MAG: RNA polymerase-binding protein DksA [Curvibacter sp.]|nr:RNA polymerase-binding protein DksA [Curvibacter sp.]
MKASASKTKATSLKAAPADKRVAERLSAEASAGPDRAGAPAPRRRDAAPGHVAAAKASLLPGRADGAAGPPSVEPASGQIGEMPPRSGRPSSRLTQFTVPSMATAPAVAPTAAKASFLHTMPTTLNATPPFAATKKDPKLANNWKAKPVEQLTDEEVLAMPDGEYMNEKQTAFFRLKLTRLKQDMLNNAGETTEHLREDTVVVPDPADRATIEEEHALELRTRDRERKLLKKIEQSIARIDAGDYGYCDETGEPIGVGRLLARPTATLSLEAQQRRELKQKMFGD